MLEILVMALVVINCLAMGVVAGFVYFKTYSHKFESQLLVKLDATREQFEATAKAASEANMTQARKIIELGDKVNSLALGNRKISSL